MLCGLKRRLGKTPNVPPKLHLESTSVVVNAVKRGVILKK
jgi:hypothetical protein